MGLYGLPVHWQIRTAKAARVNYTEGKAKRQKILTVIERISFLKLSVYVTTSEGNSLCSILLSEREYGVQS